MSARLLPMLLLVAALASSCSKSKNSREEQTPPVSYATTGCFRGPYYAHGQEGLGGNGASASQFEAGFCIHAATGGLIVQCDTISGQWFLPDSAEQTQSAEFEKVFYVSSDTGFVKLGFRASGDSIFFSKLTSIYPITRWMEFAGKRQ